MRQTRRSRRLVPARIRARLRQRRRLVPGRIFDQRSFETRKELFSQRFGHTVNQPLADLGELTAHGGLHGVAQFDPSLIRDQ